jgi:hypothetical protein
MNKIPSRPQVLWPAHTPREPQVQQEIEEFLAALNSYPERFSRNPHLSFEQHLFSVVTANQFKAYQDPIWKHPCGCVSED